MSDPISLLGAAAAIVQFIGLGSKIVRVLWGIGRRGAAEEVLPTPVAAIDDLQKILHELTHSGLVQPEGGDDENGLDDIVKHCEEATRRMIQLLAKVKMPAKADVDGRREFVAAAIRHAWLLVWKDGDIRKLQSNLEQLRQQLSVHLLVILRYGAAMSPSRTANPSQRPRKAFAQRAARRAQAIVRRGTANNKAGDYRACSIRTLDRAAGYTITGCGETVLAGKSRLTHIGRK
jgi:hypothetical protein